MGASNLYERLATQALRRELTSSERALGQALEQIFASGVHDFAAVAARLSERKIDRPSGAQGPWSAETLLSELAAINASLDAAYATAPPIGAYA